MDPDSPRHCQTFAIAHLFPSVAPTKDTRAPMEVTTSQSQTNSAFYTSWPFARRLPQEICDLIIDMPTTKKTHSFLCLVCRAWLPRARLRLFERVPLCSQSQAQTFLRIVLDYPKYGEFVDALVAKPLQPRNEVADDVLLSCEWIHRIVLSLPPLLPNLQELKLESLPVLHPTFPILCSRFKSIRTLSIQTRTPGSNTTNSERWSFCDIVKIISQFPKLRSLDLSIDENLSGTVRYHRKRQQPLTRLMFDSFNAGPTRTELAKWVVARQSLSELAELYWRILTTPDPELNFIIQGCTSSLKMLELELLDQDTFDHYGICS